MTPRVCIAVLVLLLAAAAWSADPAPPRTDAYGDPLPPGAVMRIGTVRWRHHSNPQCIQFAPDGKTIFSRDMLGAWLWEAETGKPICYFRVAGLSRSAALSTDGKRVAATERDGVKLWDAATGNELAGFQIPRTFPGHLAFAPNGDILAIAGNNTVELWDTSSAKLIESIPDPVGRVESLAFSRDGKLIAYGSIGGAIRVWDLHAKRRLATLAPGGPAGNERMHALDFSLDGRTLITGGSRAASNGDAARQVPVIRFWEILTGKLRLEITPKLATVAGEVVSLAIAPDGRSFASISRNGELTLWDSRTAERLRDFADPPNIAYPQGGLLAFSPDGTTLAAAGNANMLYFWNVATGQRVSRIPSVEGWLSNMAFTKDGKLFATTGSDNSIRLFDARSGKQLAELTRNDTYSFGIAASPDGRFLVTASSDGSVRSFDLITQAELWSEKLGAHRVSGLAISPDSRLVAIAHAYYQSGPGPIPPVPPEGEQVDFIQFRDTATGKLVRNLRAALGRSGGWLAFAADGGSIFVRNWGDGSINRYDVQSGKILKKTPAPDDLTSSHLLPEHSRCAVGTQDGRAIILDLEKGTEIQHITVDPGRRCAVALSEDGKYLATRPADLGLSDRTGTALRRLAVRELTSGKVLWSFDLSDDLWLVHHCFTPDGKQLVTGTSKGTILFWDWQTGAEKGGK